MGSCRDGILVEGKEMQVPSRAIKKMKGKPDSSIHWGTLVSTVGSTKYSLFCGKKIEIPNIFHKSAHTEDENFNLLIKSQRKYTFERIFRSYWKKNYYFYYAVQKQRSAFLNARACVCVLNTFLCVLLQIIYLIFFILFSLVSQ